MMDKNCATIWMSINKINLFITSNEINENRRFIHKNLLSCIFSIIKYRNATTYENIMKI